MSLPRIPRDPENDYSREAAARRRDLIREETGAGMEHVSSFSFDPSVLPGNIENFIAMAYLRMSKLKHLPQNPLVPAVARDYGRYRHVC